MATTTFEPEATAKAILACFDGWGARPGDRFMLGAVWQTLQSEGHHAREFAAGLRYAVDHGWIEHELAAETLTVTSAGLTAR